MTAQDDEALLDAKASILTGADMWSLPAAPDLGFPGLTMSDGPIGVRGVRWTGDPSVALPSPTALAATWDVSLVQRVGALLAQEARRKDVRVLLAPTVNLQRSPLGGRHFECFSEDPLLTGLLAAAYVRGVQGGNVAVTVKHFVANDFETERMTASVTVSERALRELYLLPFEIVVREAGPWGIMSAYNAVNGVRMSENDALINGVLREEWGFDGFVVSDWFGAHDTVAAALGGLDVAMPGMLSPFGPPLAAAVREGKVPPEVVDAKAARVLDLARRTSAPAPATRYDGAAIAREVSARAMTLLRNDGVLPLAGAPRIALIGGLAKESRIMGGGSAQVTPERAVSAFDGLTAAGLDVGYARGADPSERLLPATVPVSVIAKVADGSVLAELDQPEAVIQWVGQLPEGIDPGALDTVVLRGTLTPGESGEHLLGLEGTGPFRLTVDGETLFDGVVAPESADPFASVFFPPQTVFARALEAGRPVTVEVAHRAGAAAGPVPFLGFALLHREPRPDADSLLAEAVRAAAEADVAVVVVGTSKEVESEGFDRTSLRLPGRQDELVARVAAANPRTVVVVNAGSPVEMPWRDEVAALLLTWFPGQEGGHALADVLTGAAEPGGRLPTTWPTVLEDCPVVDVTPKDGVLEYGEGIFVGYPAWQRAGTAPAFEFGSGLGYTTWSYESAEHTEGVLTVTVRNTGARPGREVVQVYLSPAVPDPERPARRLVGFAVAEAGPGESTTVTVPVPDRAYATWHDGAWRPNPGPYLLHTGHSLTDTRLTTPVEHT
ncbi:glycoside hydrolase family 3 protein [Actinocorallia sp. A-T 12471]|uniref:glycoside hydrolase family 3 protein n=1 Tax=Actinocorallia sp. A-T 12471 TaxID=3089813 RepID=UPI0029D40806|nr:glycoside hydrolase family 3 C-terminal domain-containing protein [Actinocorallia sp. A-T 12471]MDX6744803.1 glycoside hydrolase family 3 C-terminal domain-containing protein [Actinocorallia sp. A-T 12471]